MRTKLSKWPVDSSQFFMMMVGSFILAFTYYHINFQNGLSEGGLVGLALLGKYLFDLPPALTTLVLDIAVLALAFLLNGRGLIVNALLGSMMFSGFYELFDRFSPIIVNLHDSLPLAAVLSGIFVGIGAGLVIRSGGGSGGDDILAIIISERTGAKIGTIFILMDAAVLLISLFYLPFIETMYTIMAVFISGQMITWTTNYGKREPISLNVPYRMKDKTARA